MLDALHLSAFSCGCLEAVLLVRETIRGTVDDTPRAWSCTWNLSRATDRTCSAKSIKLQIVKKFVVGLVLTPILLNTDQRPIEATRSTFRLSIFAIFVF